MKRIALAVVVLACALAAAGCTTGRYAQYERPPRIVSDTLSTMKTQDVITLSKAGVSDSLIITMLDVSGSWFNLKTRDVLDLKNAGVSDKVINAMFASSAPAADTRNREDGAYASIYAPYYPPYYWYAGFYSYWPYWEYPSLYYGFNYYHPVAVRRYTYPNRIYNGSYGGGGGGRSGGRSGGHRR